MPKSRHKNLNLILWLIWSGGHTESQKDKKDFSKVLWLIGIRAGELSVQAPGLVLIPGQPWKGPTSAASSLLSILVNTVRGGRIPISVPRPQRFKWAGVPQGDTHLEFSPSFFFFSETFLVAKLGHSINHTSLLSLKILDVLKIKTQKRLFLNDSPLLCRIPVGRCLQCCYSCPDVHWLGAFRSSLTSVCLACQSSQLPRRMESLLWWYFRY